MPDDTKTESCMLRLFGADPAALAEAVGRFAPQWKATAEWRSRGNETLLALHASDPAGLKKAAHSLHTSFPAELYGEGETSLAAAVVETLERCDRLLVCSDASAGALLDARLENVPGAEKVFDFGTLSYAHPQTGPQIEKRARAKLHLPAGETPDPLRLALARAQATRRIVGAELAAGCAEREQDKVLILCTKKGCWLRTVRADDSPALWLMDMIRRAAAGLPQAKGTGFLPARKTASPNPSPSEPPPKPSKSRKHWLRRVLVLLLLVLLAAFAAAWYWTNGQLTALPEQLRAFGLFGTSGTPHSGARLL